MQPKAAEPISTAKTTAGKARRDSEEVTNGHQREMLVLMPDSIFIQTMTFGPYKVFGPSQTQ